MKMVLSFFVKKKESQPHSSIIFLYIQKNYARMKDEKIQEHKGVPPSVAATTEGKAW